MSILRVKDDKGNIIPIPAIKGDKGDKGERGDTGVYVGSGAIPDGCNVKIDPNGEADDVVTRAEFEELKGKCPFVFKTVSVTITESTWCYVDYPDGFNFNNTFIVSAMLLTSGAEKELFPTTIRNTHIPQGVITDSKGIGVYMVGSAFNGKNVTVMIARNV